MKKLLLGSIVLTAFSISIILFQISCQKEVNAQTGNSYVLPPATTSTLGGVTVGSGLTVNNAGVLSANSTIGLTQQNVLLLGTQITPTGGFILINYDGTNKRTVPISLPAGRILNGSDGKLSPDGKIIFFEVYESNTNTHFIYSCLTDGANLKIIHSSTTDDFNVLGAY